MHFRPAKPFLAGLRALAVLAPFAAGAIAPVLAAEPGPGLQAIIETEDTRFAMGEPIEVRFSLWNPGSKEVRPVPDRPLTKGFVLLDGDGKPVAAAPGGTVDGPQTASLPPGGHYGVAFDLARLYPRLNGGGTFRFYWQQGALKSNQVVLKIVPAYDPKRTYRAEIQTDQGVILIDFYPDKAPLAVKNFIELALEGFYDGTKIYYVDPGRMIAGGDPIGDGSGTPGFTYPAERNDLQMLAGTIAMKKAGTPPTNGSQFFILLTPRPEMNGQFTVFAQVVEGLETAQRLSKTPNTGPQSRPPNRPLTDQLIRKIVISEKSGGTP